MANSVVAVWPKKIPFHMFRRTRSYRRYKKLVHKRGLLNIKPAFRHILRERKLNMRYLLSPGKIVGYWLRKGWGKNMIKAAKTIHRYGQSFKKKKETL